MAAEAVLLVVSDMIVPSAAKHRQTEHRIGLELARKFVAGDPARFRRLLREQLTPEDLAA